MHREMVERIRWSLWVLIPVVVFLFGIDQLCMVAHRNFGYVFLCKALASSHIRAVDRQTMLVRSLAFLNSAGELDVPLWLDNQHNSEDMLRAIFIGEYHRSRGDIDEAAGWYLRAAQSVPWPPQQSSLLYVRRDRLLPDGSILVTDFSDINEWVPDSANNTDVVLSATDGITRITYQNNFNQRDFVSYLLYLEGMQLGYHTVLSMRVRVGDGSFLTLETRVDNALERHLHYYRGGGAEWETLRFPLQGNVLQMIKLGVSEPDEARRAINTYEVWLDWVRLELAVD